MIHISHTIQKNLDLKSTYSLAIFFTMLHTRSRASSFHINSGFSCVPMKVFYINKLKNLMKNFKEKFIQQIHFAYF